MTHKQQTPPKQGLVRSRRERTAARECQAYTENSWAETFRPVIFIAVIDNGMGFAIINVRPDKRKSEEATTASFDDGSGAVLSRKTSPSLAIISRSCLQRRFNANP